MELTMQELREGQILRCTADNKLFQIVYASKELTYAKLCTANGAIDKNECIIKITHDNLRYFEIASSSNLPLQAEIIDNILYTNYRRNVYIPENPFVFRKGKLVLEEVLATSRDRVLLKVSFENEFYIAVYSALGEGFSIISGCGKISAYSNPSAGTALVFETVFRKDGELSKRDIYFWDGGISLYSLRYDNCPKELTDLKSSYELTNLVLTDKLIILQMNVNDSSYLLYWRIESSKACNNNVPTPVKTTCRWFRCEKLEKIQISESGSKFMIQTMEGNIVVLTTEGDIHGVVCQAKDLPYSLYLPKTQLNISIDEPDDNSCTKVHMLNGLYEAFELRGNVF